MKLKTEYQSSKLSRLLEDALRDRAKGDFEVRLLFEEIDRLRDELGQITLAVDSLAMDFEGK
jgi:hypothetical protein